MTHVCHIIPYHPCLVYLPTWMVDFYGFSVGKYTTVWTCFFMRQLSKTKRISWYFFLHQLCWTSLVPCHEWFFFADAKPWPDVRWRIAWCHRRSGLLGLLSWSSGNVFFTQSVTRANHCCNYGQHQKKKTWRNMCGKLLLICGVCESGWCGLREIL